MSYSLQGAPALPISALPNRQPPELPNKSPYVGPRGVGGLGSIKRLGAVGDSSGLLNGLKTRDGISLPGTGSCRER